MAHLSGKNATRKKSITLFFSAFFLLLFCKFAVSQPNHRFYEMFKENPCNAGLMFYASDIDFLRDCLRQMLEEKGSVEIGFSTFSQPFNGLNAPYVIATMDSFGVDLVNFKGDYDGFASGHNYGTPLYSALERNHLAAVKTFLALGEDLNRVYSNDLSIEGICDALLAEHGAWPFYPKSKKVTFSTVTEKHACGLVREVKLGNLARPALQEVFDEYPLVSGTDAAKAFEVDNLRFQIRFTDFETFKELFLKLENPFYAYPRFGNHPAEIPKQEYANRLFQSLVSAENIENQIDYVKFLLEQGLEIHKKGYASGRPIYLAISTSQDIEVIKELIGAGDVPNRPDSLETEASKRSMLSELVGAEIITAEEARLYMAGNLDVVDLYVSPIEYCSIVEARIEKKIKFYERYNDQGYEDEKIATANEKMSTTRKTCSYLEGFSTK